MLDSIIIRPIERDDFSQWQILWEGYNRFYGRTKLLAEITKTTWTRFFDSSEPVYALVAENNSEILGLAHYLFHRSTIQIGFNCYLQDLFTIETARNQGVGRKLIEAVFEQAKFAKSRRVYWQTQESNVAARKLYDKVAKFSGFIVYANDLQ